MDQPYHCPRPHCNKLLGKVTWLDEGRRVVIETECKRCKEVVTVVVIREEGAKAA